MQLRVMQDYQKIVIIGERLNFFEVPFSVILKIKSINAGIDLSLYRLTQKMFKISKKTWLLVAFLMLAMPSFSEIFKPATSFRLEDSFGGKVKLSAIPLKTDLVTKVQLKENKLKVSNGHDQLTIKLKIKVDKDLQHYDVEKDEDSSECSKDEKWDEQHSNIKNGKESKETKESSWKESSTVTTIVKPEVKLNPSSITKIVEKLPIAASTQKTITTSLPIITSSSLSPSTFIVTSNVPKEAKAEQNLAKKDEKDGKIINNVVAPQASVIRPAIITVGKTLEESKPAPVHGSTPIVGSIQAKQEPKNIESVVLVAKKSEQKEENEKKNFTPVVSTISVGQPLAFNNIAKPSSLTVENKPIEIKKETSEGKSSQNSQGDSKKSEIKAAETIKNVANPNAVKIVIAEPTKSEAPSIVKPDEKVVKHEEKKETLPLNNAINPKFAQEILVKPAFPSLNPTLQTEIKKIKIEEAPTPSPAKKIFADAVNPLAVKRSMASGTYPATLSAQTSLAHTL